MIAWKTTAAGVMVPCQYRPAHGEKPPAPCPAHIRAKLGELRAEFAARAGIRK